ncbi:peptidase S51 [Compostimonas suwonensis]|uniref:Cyanophycinase n=1 Tax=Compostimonas suwonensis TaxID=1048394 RepID=A0A2M9BUL8_9MICO|nr:peptidase S51 [Compostimonas suwonensis]PJJ61637.1 hypothetical protein CLV54_2585 [Compostimonas suwonensis]
MSIHLVGGGHAPEWHQAVYGGFVAEAGERAVPLALPRIAVIVVHGGDHGDSDGDATFEYFRAALTDAGPCEPVAILVAEGSAVEQSSLADADALLVAGGLTPAYRDAVAPVVGEIRRLVSGGLPYLGFSAGAAIAAEAAIVGGWRIGGVAVCPSDTGEGLDEVTIAEGIGLIDLAIDAHAAQWGTLGRLVAATEAGLLDGGVAIDESTALIVGEGPLRVVGAGSVWRVLPSEQGVLVSTLGV